MIYYVYLWPLSQQRPQFRSDFYRIRRKLSFGKTVGWSCQSRKSIEYSSFLRFFHSHQRLDDFFFRFRVYQTRFYLGFKESKILIPSTAASQLSVVKKRSQGFFQTKCLRPGLDLKLRSHARGAMSDLQAGLIG